MSVKQTAVLKTGQSQSKLVESFGFMAALTFVGGYLDAYTYITRGGVFANNQTANVAKLGIELYQKNWTGAFNCLYPMLATIAGAFFAAHVMNKESYSRSNQWRQDILLVEMLALGIIGFLPLTVPNIVINLSISFIAAWQLSGFRKFEEWVHNTTIETGNLRSVGQYGYQALFVEKNSRYRIRTAKYILLVASFAVGSFIGTLFCNLLSVRAVWLCCVLLLILLILYRAASSEE